MVTKQPRSRREGLLQDGSKNLNEIHHDEILLETN
jgi:hypothetical protein